MKSRNQSSFRKKFLIPLIILLSGSYLSFAIYTNRPPSLQTKIQNITDASVQIVVPQRKGKLLGSGTIIKSDGTILTAAHLFSFRHKVIIAVLADHTKVSERIVCLDIENDLAIITPVHKGRSYKFVEISHSHVHTGDVVLASGHPWGIPPLIISWGHITNDSVDKRHLIIFDASINPGNSGGGLFNDRGELIGVNVMILTANSALPLFEPSWSGISMAQPVTPEVVRKMYLFKTYNVIKKFFVKKTHIKRS